MTAQKKKTAYGTNQEVNDGKKDTGSSEERGENAASNNTGRETTSWRGSAGRTRMRRSDRRLSLKEREGGGRERCRRRL